MLPQQVVAGFALLVVSGQAGCATTAATADAPIVVPAADKENEQGVAAPDPDAQDSQDPQTVVSTPRVHDSEEGKMGAPVPKQKYGVYSPQGKRLKQAEAEAEAAAEAAVAPEASVKIGEVTAGAGLDVEIIRRIVRAHRDEVRDCYAEGLEANPSLAGRVAVHLRISAAGKVDSGEVSATNLGDDTTQSCIAAAVKRWKFPMPLGNKRIEVDVAFELAPKG